LTRLHATPDRVATRPQDCPQLWIRLWISFGEKAGAF
jgi:hypothetical protein